MQRTIKTCLYTLENQRGHTRLGIFSLRANRKQHHLDVGDPIFFSSTPISIRRCIVTVLRVVYLLFINHTAIQDFSNLYGLRQCQHPWFLFLLFKCSSRRRGGRRGGIPYFQYPHITPLLPPGWRWDVCNMYVSCCYIGESPAAYRKTASPRYNLQYKCYKK